MKKWSLVLVLAAFMIMLVACGKSEDKNSNDTTPSPSASANNTTGEDVKPTGKVVAVTLNASNFVFDVKEIKANVGDTVRVTLVNKAGAHGVEFSDFDTKLTGGETKEFVVTKAGTFEYNCSLMCGVGHDKMVGKLIVT